MPARFGVTPTPYDLERSAGGSSGGSAAAVAARMVPMASGGDGGGSIRMPASCCGVFGFKPSRGRVPHGPFEATAWEGYSVEHVLTRSVRDSAACLDATAGPAAGEMYHAPPAPAPFLAALDREPGRLRIAFSHRTPLSDGLAPECQAALLDAVSLLSDLGHELIEAEPSFDGRRWKRTNNVMMAGIVAADVRDAAERMGKPATHEGFETATWVLRAMGEAFSAGDYASALRFQLRTGQAVAKFASEYDAWLTPTLARPPIRHGELSLSGVLGQLQAWIGRFELGGVIKRFDLADADTDRLFGYMPFTMLANSAGLPSMSLPLYWTPVGLPIGVMLTGAFGDDAGLLQLAAQLERARPFDTHWPIQRASPGKD